MNTYFFKISIFVLKGILFSCNESNKSDSTTINKISEKYNASIETRVDSLLKLMTLEEINTMGFGM